MWLLFGFTASLASSINGIYLKKLVHKVYFLVVPIGMFLFAIPFLFVFLQWSPDVQFTNDFWMGLIATSIFNVLANTLAYKALELEDVSFLAPLAAFNPVFTMIISFFTLHEVPSPLGVAGIFTIGVGAVLLSTTKGEKLWHAIRNFYRNRAIQYTTLVYIIWAITPTFEKIALRGSNPESPVHLAIGMCILIALGMLPLAILRKSNPFGAIVRRIPMFLLVGGLAALTIVTAFYTFSLVNLGYATAVIRKSMFFTMLLAALFLKEKLTRLRIGAGLLMFLGVILLTI